MNICIQELCLGNQMLIFKSDMHLFFKKFGPSDEYF